MDIKVEKAKLGELAVMWTLYQQVTESIVLKGIDQWDSIYPTMDMIRNNIEHEYMYVAIMYGALAAAFV